MRHLSVLLILLGLLVATPTLAQNDADSPPPQPKEPAKAELIGQATMAGSRFYRPGTWGMIAANLSNPTTEPADLFFTSWIAPGIDTQFARRVWLPPRSRMRIAHPIYVPNNARIASSNSTGEIETLVIDESTSIQTRAGRGSNLLLFNLARPSTAHISDPTSDQPGAAIVAARLSASLPPTTSPMRPDELPFESATLEVIDLLVISNRTPRFDADQLAAVRGWLSGGGRLWIMLDRVDPEFGRSLLRDDWGIDVVDDIHTTTTAVRDAAAPPPASGRYPMQIKLMANGDITFDGNPVGDVEDLAAAVGAVVNQLPSRDAADPGRRISAIVEPLVAPQMLARVYQAVYSSGGRIVETIRSTDEPVHMRRVVADGMEPLFTVDGWPVAMRRTIGRGEVYVTTIDPAALMSGRDGAMPALRQLAEMTLVKSSHTELPPARFTPLVSSQIGYRIAGRSTVASLLLGLVASLIIGSLVLAKLGRLEWLAPLGAVASVVVTVGFIFLGLASRRSQPLTMSTGGLVEVVGGTQATYNAKLSVYSPEPIAMNLQGTRGGLTLPETDALSASVKRLVWTDRHHWQWTGLELRSGDVKSTFVRTDLTFDKAAHASFTFDKDGAVGAIDGSALQGFQPQFIAYQMLHARVGGSGDMRSSRPDDLLSAGNFSAGALQDASAAVKQNITEQLVRSGGLPDMPTVIGWSDRMETGVTLPGLSEYRGATLVTMPVKITPPAADTQVTVPAVFVRLEPARAPSGGSLRAIFGMGSVGWPEAVADSQWFTIRFVLPPEVMPMDVRSATLLIDSRAPSQQLTVAGYDGVKRETITTINNPSGTQTVSINNPALLTTDSEGGILLSFRFGASASNQGEMPKWRIERLGLDIQGTARATSSN
jgi:hypothetical protein